MKLRGCICPLSWSVHCNFVRDGNVTIKKGDGRAPPHAPARAKFSFVLECTPEIGHCYSVCTLWLVHVTSLNTVQYLT